MNSDPKELKKNEQFLLKRPKYLKVKQDDETLLIQYEIRNTGNGGGSILLLLFFIAVSFGGLIGLSIVVRNLVDGSTINLVQIVIGFICVFVPYSLWSWLFLEVTLQLSQKKISYNMSSPLPHFAYRMFSSTQDRADILHFFIATEADSYDTLMVLCMQMQNSTKVFSERGEPELMEALQNEIHTFWNMTEKKD